VIAELQRMTRKYGRFPVPRYQFDRFLSASTIARRLLFRSMRLRLTTRSTGQAPEAAGELKT